MSKRHKQAKMFPLVKQYLSGKLSQTKFCESHGIKIHNFQYWLSKYKQNRTGGEISSHQFIPIELNNNNNNNNNKQDQFIRISYPSGMIIDLPIF